jgi:hypothetical protein
MYVSCQGREPSSIDNPSQLPLLAPSPQAFPEILRLPCQPRTAARRMQRDMPPPSLDTEISRKGCLLLEKLFSPGRQALDIYPASPRPSSSGSWSEMRGMDLAKSPVFGLPTSRGKTDNSIRAVRGTLFPSCKNPCSTKFRKFPACFVAFGIRTRSRAKSYLKKEKRRRTRKAGKGGEPAEREKDNRTRQKHPSNKEQTTMGSFDGEFQRRRTKSIKSKEHYDKVGPYSNRHLRILAERAESIVGSSGSTTPLSTTSSPASSGSGQKKAAKRGGSKAKR